MIIGFSGKARAGKDTSADYLVEHFGAVKIALADEIKRTAKRWWHFSNSQLWGPSETREETPYLHPDGPTARKACQIIGTEVARQIDENIWINILLTTADSIQNDKGIEYSQDRGIFIHNDFNWPRTELVVVPDVRYKNEMEAIRKYRGLVVRIKRPAAGLTGKEAAHLSETEQDSVPDSFFDYVIENDGTIDQLNDKLSEMTVKMGVV